MERIDLPPRPDLREKAEAAGFTFHEMHGLPYWDETSAWAFSLEEIENGIEDPVNGLHAMCREAVAHVVQSEQLMARMGIPPEHMDLVAGSWNAQEPELYGRMDLAWDGQEPAKLLEYNADTPTSLYEASGFQWDWLEDMMARGALPQRSDQFNGIHEALIARFAQIIAAGTDVHFTSVGGNAEDYGTVETLAWAARDAGLTAHYVPIEQVGLSQEGQFLDDESRVIGTLFKLYPWEDLLREEYGARIATSGCRFIEPAWKSILSNKGLLPVLWSMFEGHPNLLPAFFADEATSANPAFARAERAFELMGWVEKPLFSREGASISIHQFGKVERSKSGGYEDWPRIRQLYTPMARAGRDHAVFGAWVVGQTCVGLGVREDESRITQDLSRFKPHFILPEPV